MQKTSVVRALILLTGCAYFSSCASPSEPTQTEIRRDLIAAMSQQATMMGASRQDPSLYGDLIIVSTRKERRRITYTLKLPYGDEFYEGTLTYNDEKGKYVPGTLSISLVSVKQAKDLKQRSASALPIWLPKYPTAQEDLSDEKELNFFTSDSASKVIAFYKEALNSCGFSVDDKPKTGKFAPIGGGQFRTLKAERRKEGEYIEIEIAVHEETAARVAVIGIWSSKRP